MSNIFPVFYAVMFFFGIGLIALGQSSRSKFDKSTNEQMDAILPPLQRRKR